MSKEMPEKSNKRPGKIAGAMAGAAMMLGAGHAVNAEEPGGFRAPHAESREKAQATKKAKERADWLKQIQQNADEMGDVLGAGSLDKRAKEAAALEAMKKEDAAKARRLAEVFTEKKDRKN